MNKILIAVLAVMSLATVGCKKKGADAAAKMTEFKNAMCACKDKACAEKVGADMMKWTSENAKAGEGMKGDPKMKAIGEEMAKCMATAMGMGGMMGGEGSAAPAGGEGGSAAPAGGEGGSAAPAGGSAAAPPAGGSAAPAGGSAAK